MMVKVVVNDDKGNCSVHGEGKEEGKVKGNGKGNGNCNGNGTVTVMAIIKVMAE